MELWADGRLRFPGETRKGFDSVTGKRTCGRPRKLPVTSEPASSRKYNSMEGVFSRVYLRVLSSRLEHYIVDKKVAYIEITDIGTTLVLNDSSRVKV